jgi:hypothetical protein
VVDALLRAAFVDYAGEGTTLLDFIEGTLDLRQFLFLDQRLLILFGGID